MWNKLIRERALDLCYGNCDLFVCVSEIVHRQCIEKEKKGILWNTYTKQEKGRYFEEKGRGNIGA